RGIDERPVEPEQPVRSVSSEDTFAQDLPLEALEPAIRQLAEKTWNASRRAGRAGHTVVLKLKTAQFRILTRSLTLERPPASAAELGELACALRARVALPADTRYRLVGVGLSGFRDAEEVAPQGDLFGELAVPAGAPARLPLWQGRGCGPPATIRHPRLPARSASPRPCANIGRGRRRPAANPELSCPSCPAPPSSPCPCCWPRAWPPPARPPLPTARPPKPAPPRRPCASCTRPSGNGASASTATSTSRVAGSRAAACPRSPRATGSGAWPTGSR